MSATECSAFKAAMIQMRSGLDPAANLASALDLIEEAKQAGYDSGLLLESGSFQVGDVLFTAIYAAASDLLADLARRLRKPDDAAELKDYAARAWAA